MEQWNQGKIVESQYYEPSFRQYQISWHVGFDMPGNLIVLAIDGRTAIIGCRWRILAQGASHMAVEIFPTALPEVRVIVPQVFGDARGFFLETYHAAQYRALGIDEVFVQDNHSHSTRNVLRGLHYQLRHPQTKLVIVTRGTIFDVAVDIRRGSPTFGRWVGETLSGENHRQILVPRGFAHGFCVLTPEADVLYKCTDFYDPADDRGILWSDPDIGIVWPVDSPSLSGKDQRHPRLRETTEDALPVYKPGAAHR